MRRAPITADPSQGWLTFLRNHREAIAAMDFFTVPTVTFGVLYCFFIIGHDWRRILQLNVTRHPTSAWIVQQLREAFPYEPPVKFLIFDHDAKFGAEAPAAIRSMSAQGGADSGRLSLAEWCGQALDRQLPPRTAGSCDCHQ